MKEIRKKKERMVGVYYVRLHFGRLVPYIKPCFERTLTAGVATSWWV
jgi:hypothetical protein